MNSKSARAGTVWDFDVATAVLLHRMLNLRSAIHIPTQTSTGPESGCGSLRLTGLRSRGAADLFP
jgi:hypothetical protein